MIHLTDRISEATRVASFDEATSLGEDFCQAERAMFARATVNEAETESGWIAEIWIGDSPAGFVVR